MMNARQRVRRSRQQKRVLSSIIILVLLITACAISLALIVNAQIAEPSQVTITVNSQGITPSTATANAGVIRLTIENQKAQQRVTLRVNDQAGETLREISVPDKATEWKTEVELPVGQFTISDVNNSSASCRITVQTPPH
jgi:predicted PurR-regulated permease PerM